MGEAEVAHIGGQHLGELAVAEPAVALLGLAPPRSEMHLVDRDRRRQRIGVGGGRAGGAGRGSAAMSTTIEPVLGRSSRANATGSALSGSSSPSWLTISYLYLAPGRTPGMNSSQNPLLRNRLAWRRPSQKLKSPTTLMRRAAGAKTAKPTPRTPSSPIR